MVKLHVGVCFAAAFASGVEGDPLRKLSYELIAGYEPGSDVTQHNMLDLDQAEMETHLKTPYYDKASAIYNLGGNSGAKAEITVSALAADAAKGAVVKQGTVAVGKMKSAASAGATAITVSYTTSVCKEGGLETKDVSGCFTVAGGAITVGGVDIGAPTAVANKYRTLAGFSTAAEKKMTGQVYFDIYKAYFKVGDYAHVRVMDALTTPPTGICKACDDAARVQIAKKTSAYMNVWMYVVREFEDAIEDCQAGCIDCNDDPVHAWDEGVAFYTGTLEGTDGSGSGKMIYALADKRCKNFGTCSGSTHSSYVNEALFVQFTKGKVALQQGKCADVAPIKKLIVELMSIPLVQGSLRYAYKVAELQGGSKEFAEGAAFSAAILPRIHACDASAAKVISDNMNMEIAESARMSAGFGPVKKAFESVYECLGITCASVGGLILEGAEYYPGAEPCGTTSKGSCYNAKGDHSVECNVAEADCGGSYYATGFVSSRSGCCHCKASCPMVSDACTYYDAPKPASDSHDGHDHDGADDHGASGPEMNGKKLTCDDETYLKPVLDGLASTFENYASCNEETQKYTLTVSGYDTELQAGKNGNANKYGIGMMCEGGAMYYIYTEDTDQATWDALKASPPDTSKVLLKCLLKEGGSGGGGGGDGSDTTAGAVHASVGMAALMGAVLLA